VRGVYQCNAALSHSIINPTSDPNLAYRLGLSFKEQRLVVSIKLPMLAESVIHVAVTCGKGEGEFLLNKLNTELAHKYSLVHYLPVTRNAVRS
jgi:hypothetical protein